MINRRYRPLGTSFDVPKAARLLGLHHDIEGFRILLEEYSSPPTFRRFKISFPSTPFAFRMIDEGDYLTTVGKGGGVFSEVENSEFLHWFQIESQQVRGNQKLRHYAVYSINECFDILHSDFPIICEL